MVSGKAFSKAGGLKVLAALLALGLTAGTVSADSLVGETRYTDSFGNLIIHSPSGHKRILVGQGHSAAAEVYAKKPKVAYLERRRGRIYLRERPHCPYGVLLKGRSYMYGLPDNAVPVLTAPCRR